jgi:GMP synthase-like glutamine amidotransferase
VRILCLQHVPFEGPGTIEAWARSRGHSFEVLRLFDGDPLPGAGTFDGLVVMGGPMSVHDDAAFPWLAAEKRLIRGAVEGGRLVLGVCLGAQLIAASLGARVYAGGCREIGWHEARATAAAAGSRLCAALPRAFTAFHWHGDTFDLPPGAVHTAASAAFAHQAFEIAPAVLGLQFHLEATPRGVAGLVDACGGDLAEGGRWVQSAAEILGRDAPFAANTALLSRLLDSMEHAFATGD